MKLRVGALALLVSLTGVLGCPPGPGAGGPARKHTRAPSAADLEGIEQIHLQVEPSGPSVASYGTPIEHPLLGPEQAIVDALKGQPIAHRPALSRMTRELARTSPGRLDMPPSLVDGLMAWSGLADPAPRIIVVELPRDPYRCHQAIAPQCREAVASLVQEVRNTMPKVSPLLFGVGVAGLPDGRTRMMVALSEPAVSLRPIPLSVQARGSFSVEGRLIGNRSKPVVEVVGPDGRWQRMPTSVSVNGGFRAQVGCTNGQGRYQVEVLVEGTHGVEVAANFPVYCGARPPTTIDVTQERVDGTVTAEQLARANFLYLNLERRQRGLPELEWDASAAVVARAHSLDMHDNGFVGHVSATTGDVTARFSRAGLGGRVIRENVARGYGPQGIHASLMSSPGHRANLLATDVTHVGIGVVLGTQAGNAENAPRPVFATQNFYKKPGAGVPSGDLGPALASRVDQYRTGRGLAPAAWDDDLSKIAQRRADALGRGRPPPADYDKEAFALGYSSVEVHHVSSSDFDALAEVDLWAAPSLHAGVGVARSAERGGAETYIVVVLVGGRE